MSQQSTHNKQTKVTVSFLFLSLKKYFEGGNFFPGPIKSNATPIHTLIHYICTSVCHIVPPYDISSITFKIGLHDFNFKYSNLHHRRIILYITYTVYIYTQYSHSHRPNGPLHCTYRSTCHRNRNKLYTIIL